MGIERSSVNHVPRSALLTWREGSNESVMYSVCPCHAIRIPRGTEQEYLHNCRFYLLHTAVRKILCVHKASSQRAFN